MLKSNNINWQAVTVLIIYPILLIALGINFVYSCSFGWFEFGTFIISYYLTNISVGIGLHRLWSHNSYKASKALEFILVLFSAGALQGPAIAWASDHFKHHAYTDKEQDPHSPLKYKNPLLGFLWSHIGWMLVKDDDHKNIDRVTVVKLGKNKLLLWQLKHYWSLAIFMNVFLPITLGYFIGRDMEHAIGAFIFAGLGRAFQQQMTMCVNSVCHFLGKRPYYKGTAGDIWWMALFLLGENWHNFHHAFPQDYRNGARWYHLDIHKWIIYILSKFKLASELQITSKVRIQSKSVETLHYLLDQQKSRLAQIKERIDEFSENLRIKANSYELPNYYLKIGKKSLNDMYDSANELTEQLISLSSQIANNSSTTFTKMLKSQTAHIENSIHQMYKEIEKIYSKSHNFKITSN